jgi:hypothetical protein
MGRRVVWRARAAEESDKDAIEAFGNQAETTANARGLVRSRQTRIRILTLAGRKLKRGLQL